MEIMETAAVSRKRVAIHAGAETETETAVSSSSKRARLGADRLDDLPACLLHDILSLLGSRQAVQTSALSRRWRHLWRSVHRIDIDQGEFRPDKVSEEALDDCQWERFEDFADVMLSTSSLRAGTAHNSARPLDEYRLRLVDNCRRTTTARWIRRGLWRRPAVVEIRHDLGHGSNIHWPTTSPLLCSDAFCRLRRLRLYGVTLRSSFGEKLGEQCPVPEDLYIHNCMYS